jgi:peroxiredoxin
MKRSYGLLLFAVAAAQLCLGCRILRDPGDEPVFIPAGSARKCPRLKVTTLEGQTGEIQLARRGWVTLVVFWTMDFNFTRAALCHANDLAEKYRAMKVQAVAILEQTASSEFGPRFAKAQKLTCPLYYDDFTALRAMGRAAGVSVGRQPPCFAMIDQEGRVRFFKRGFSFFAARISHPLILKEEIVENAAEGEYIEDYLQRLLREPQER